MIGKGLFRLGGPYTQRICFDKYRYWSVTSLETERINHSTTLKSAFFVPKRCQSIIFSLNPLAKIAKSRQKTRSQLREEALERARQWKVLSGTNGIETRADLARRPGISRARVTPGSQMSAVTSISRTNRLSIRRDINGFI
jgi:hypothetical protein